MQKSNPVMMTAFRAGLWLISDFVSNSYFALSTLSVEAYEQAAPPNLFLHWSHKCLGSALLMV
jgi:hypothetical protein